MAKTEKKVAAAAATVDNVMDSIRKGNLMPTTLHAKVQEEMAKEAEDKKKRQLKAAIGKAKYTTSLTLLQLRARRREDDITKEKLSRSAELLDKLTGICSKPGENFGKELDEKELITAVEYKEALNKLEEDIRKKSRESDEQLSKEVRELNSSDCGEYRYSWWVD